MKPILATPVLALTLAIAGVSAPALADDMAAAWQAMPAAPNSFAVRGGSAPVDRALATIIPAPYRIVLDNGVPPSASLVWRSGDNWMDVLKEAVAPLGLDVRADWSQNIISIVRDRPAPVMAGASAVTYPAPSVAAPVATPATMPPVAATMAKPAYSPHPAYELPKPTTPVPSLDQLAAAERAEASKPVFAEPVAATPVIAPSTPSAEAGYTIPAGVNLSRGLAKYVERFGWTLRWKISEDYMLDAPLPIPQGTLQEGINYVMQSYRAQGGMGDATATFANPNKVVVLEYATAKESN